MNATLEEKEKATATANMVIPKTSSKSNTVSNVTTSLNTADEKGTDILFSKDAANKVNKLNNTGYVFWRRDNQALTMTEVYKFINLQKSKGVGEFSKDFPVHLNSENKESITFKIQNSKYKYYEYVFDPNFGKKKEKEKPKDSGYTWSSTSSSTAKPSDIKTPIYTISHTIPTPTTSGEPTTAEAAAMANDVYNPTYKTLQGGWSSHVLDHFKLKYSDSESGFGSQLYQRKKANAKNTDDYDSQFDYCYVTRGTDMKSGADWETNLLQIEGFKTRQYTISQKNALTLHSKLSSSSLTFAGHSLGGGLAASNAYSTGRNAITFNPAGLSKSTIIRAILTNRIANKKKYKNPKIDAYIMATDPLNILQDGSRSLPNADGTRHYIVPQNFSAVYNGHSMDNMCIAMGVPINN